MSKFDEEDFRLTAEQLDDKYNPEGDGEHPVFTRWDWTQAVAQRSTLLGYWKWTLHQLDEAYFEYCRGPDMTNLYRVQATIWIEAESGKAAAETVFNDVDQLIGLDNGITAVEVEKDGEFVEEIG